MAELASNHDDLPAVVALVRDEIGEHMPNVERQVAPYISLRRRDLSACRNPKLEKLLDTATTPLQRYQQTPTRDLAPVDSSGNAVLNWLFGAGGYSLSARYDYGSNGDFDNSSD